MVIEEARVEDAGEILILQKLAYRSEAEIYNDYSLPPLRETREGIEGEFENQIVLKALENGKIIGSVRAYMREGTCFIGRLIVQPEVQNQGIGAALMREIEKRFSQAKRFELFTGHLSQRNLYLYKKLGYQAFRREKVYENLELVYLEKPNHTTSESTTAAADKARRRA